MKTNIFIVKHFKNSEEFETFQKEDKYKIQSMTIHADYTISITCIECQEGLNHALTALDIVRLLFLKNGKLQEAAHMQGFINEALNPNSKIKI